jgi:hypothetical protein
MADEAEADEAATGALSEEQAQLSYSQSHTVMLPQGQRMILDTGDWRRIRENVETLGDSLTDRAMLWASVLAGAALALLGIVVSVKVSE